MASYNTNLLQNPGAEESLNGSTAIPNWTTTGPFQEVRYGGNATGSLGDGNQLFEGGPNNTLSSAYQDVPIADLAQSINSGQVNAVLSGKLGGFQDQRDFMTLSVDWLDGSGANLGRLNAPVVTPADRGNQSILLPVSTNGTVPAGAVTARVTMTATGLDGSFNNGYADNVSLVLQPVCFVTGSRIRTARGEVAVEDLRVGDVAVTASGARKPIRWIGSRTLNPRRHATPAEAQPVRIRAHALGEHKPARDLWVSPGHAIALDVLGEVLIPASALINDATIVQEDVASVTYWHIELDSHDLLLAEGLAAESYLDMGNRAFFGQDGLITLHAGPDADPSRRTHADFCRPFHADGPRVTQVRAGLNVRAEALGWRLRQPNPFAEVYLEVDGRVVLPTVQGLSGRFVLPADAQMVFLVAPTQAPGAIGQSPDRRPLGLCLSGLRLDDGLSEPRVVALDDPRLDAGFHAPEPPHRWTDARAHLPSSLFAGLVGPVFLRVDLRVPSLPRWVAPETTGCREAVAV